MLNVIMDEIGELGRNWEPRVLYRSRECIIFIEVEDLIAWILRNRRKIAAFRVPAYRFYVSEETGRRYYYQVEVRLFPLSGYVKLIAGDATDYSGHGSHDKVLAETFIEKMLGVIIESRPASYLIDELIASLVKSSKQVEEGV